MPNVYMPPCRLRPAPHFKTVFLAGAIDMGQAVNWQDQVTHELRHQSLAFYNPRRDDWDSSWEQKVENQKFNEQVNWELDMIKEADIVFFYLPKESTAPITLMEFGIVMGAAPHKAIVCVEEGYWRRGNIEVVCNRERVYLHKSLQGGIIELMDHCLV